MTDILKFSDSSSLAFHAMALLTKYPGRRISSTKMAELFDASEHTLAKVMHDLVRGGYVDSVRGAGGGFSLTREPAKVTMLELYELIDGPLEEQHCLLGKPACHGKECVMQGLLGTLHKDLRAYLSRTCLDTLARAIEIGEGEWGKEKAVTCHSCVGGAP